jgi:predicted alpha/beta hydrolase family esterase
MKRVVIAHGWDGTPQEGWFPWLKAQLETKAFQVIIPQLPDAGSPRIKNWVPALAAATGTVDEKTYFVGHSMGCQTIARYLETLPKGQKSGGAVFVAGFFKNLTNTGDDDNSKETEKEWLSVKPDFEKVKSHLLKSTAIFSDDDPYVPLDNQDDFRDELGSEIIVEHGMNHFNESSGCFELPVALESVLKLAQS